MWQVQSGRAEPTASPTSISGHIRSRHPRTACCRRKPGHEQLEKWTGLYVEPGEGDRVMRVRLRDGELQSALMPTALALGLEATGEARFRSIREPQTELVFEAGENGPLIY